MILLFILVFTGCVSVSHEQYNTDDTQDPSCYSSYQGESGYCTRTEWIGK